jgi:hypothetical protein
MTATLVSCRRSGGSPDVQPTLDGSVSYQQLLTKFYTAEFDALYDYDDGSSGARSELRWVVRRGADAASRVDGVTRGEVLTGITTIDSTDGSETCLWSITKDETLAHVSCLGHHADFLDDVTFVPDVMNATPDGSITVGRDSAACFSSTESRGRSRVCLRSDGIPVRIETEFMRPAPSVSTITLVSERALSDDAGWMRPIIKGVPLGLDADRRDAPLDEFDFPEVPLLQTAGHGF